MHKPTLELYQLFINACRVNPTIDRYALFSSIFNMPKATIDTLEFFGMSKVTTPANKLERQLQTILQLNYQTVINDTLQNLLEQYCPEREASTELYILDEHDTFGREMLGGVSAFADFDGTLTFIAYPDESVRHTLQSTITHEFHHFWRIGHIKITEENETLLDRLILEGLAEHFVGSVLGKESQGPFIDALTEKQAQDLWGSDYQKHQFLKGEATNSWMFGGEGNLPLWSGYSMGYHLVKWYCDRHPEQTIEELTVLPSKAFI